MRANLHSGTSEPGFNWPTKIMGVGGLFYLFFIFLETKAEIGSNHFHLALFSGVPGFTCLSQLVALKQLGVAPSTVNHSSFLLFQMAGMKYSHCTERLSEAAKGEWDYARLFLVSPESFKGPH